MYTLSLKESTKLKGLLEVVSSSTEFENIPIRRHEDALLRRVYDRVPVKLDHVSFEAPHFKTFLLLQAHFSRLQLPPDLAADQALVLEKVLNLLSACVDVMSSNAWLNATRAMDLSQMCVQAMWDTESPLKQVPHFEPDVSNLICRYCVAQVTDGWPFSPRLSNAARKRTSSLSTTSWRWKTISVPTFCVWTRSRCKSPLLHSL